MMLLSYGHLGPISARHKDPDLVWVALDRLYQHMGMMAEPDYVAAAQLGVEVAEALHTGDMSMIGCVDASDELLEELFRLLDESPGASELDIAVHYFVMAALLLAGSSDQELAASVDEVLDNLKP